MSYDEHFKPGGMYRPDPTRSDQHYDHSAGGLGTPPTWLAPNKLASSAFNSAYTDYSASLTFTSGGTAPALGNATILARYKQAGKFVHYYGKITFGSSSTFGTSTLYVSNPVSSFTSAAGLMGCAWLFDSSASAIVMAMPYFPTVDKFSVAYGATYLGTNTSITASAPWTWATSDQIAWDLLYEAA